MQKHRQRQHVDWKINIYKGNFVYFLFFQIRTENAEKRTQNTEHRLQNTERRTQNSEHRTKSHGMKK